MGGGDGPVLLPDRGRHPAHHGAGHDGVADVELGDLGNPADRPDVAGIEAVAGHRLQADLDLPVDTERLLVELDFDALLDNEPANELLAKVTFWFRV